MSECDYALGDFLGIWTPNTSQLNPLFHNFVESSSISGLPRYNPSYYWLVASEQFSSNGTRSSVTSVLHSAVVRSTTPLVKVKVKRLKLLNLIYRRYSNSTLRGGSH